MSVTGWIKANAGPMIVAGVFIVLGGLMFGLKVIADQGQDIKRLAEANEAQDRRQEEANAHTSAARTEQLNALIANTNLLRDCVGLTPGGECLKRLQALRVEGELRERRELIAALVPAVVDALERKFGILQGQLRITVVQEPGKPLEVLVGGAQPGKEPTRQAPLPPGATVQECVVELHAEPIVGACVVPR